ncbi:oxidoreductase [Nocardioides zeae]|uniref:Oxidoreductase n=1 Tax=Nocardioides imazamoxiresistens TaxID=3231893 RepID=A0ABU3PVR4_9ACTN|nr:oxidoreductase [Nocardioides zeae]MDT9593332.1 oxidoreductase [Nocardioides zeae]
MKHEPRIWSLAQMPRLDGRTALVTGPTSGIGTVTALELARAGARVVLAGRNPDKLASTAADVRGEVPDADLSSLVLDVASLASVREAAAQAADLGPLHLLVNNAGVMATPARRTVDGLDLQMATNHFGHFLLTGLLWPQLIAADDARVVSVSSLMHAIARRAPLDDPHVAPRRYARWQVYAQSKLANLLFTYELQRRAAGTGVRALAAHPGYAATHLLSAGRTSRPGPIASVLDAVTSVTAQSSADGALPTLMASTADLRGGTYCGPSGFQQVRGLPRPVGSSKLARDADAQRRLWALSEETVGLAWP